MNYQARIKELLEAKNWTINKLAMEAGITQSTLYKIMNEKDLVPNLKTIELICEAFEISLSMFFDSEDTMYPDELALLSDYNNLDDRDRLIIANLTRSLKDWK